MKTREEVRNEVLMELMEADGLFNSIRRQYCPNEELTRDSLRNLVKRIQSLQLQLAVVSGEGR